MGEHARFRYCGPIYRRARLRGEANNVWGRSIWPSRGRRQATASSDAVWAAWRMAGVVAAAQVTMRAWQAEDEPGRCGFE